MKYFVFTTKCVLLLSMVLFAAVFGVAQEERNTEIMGYYQQYRNFSFQISGNPTSTDVPATVLKGGGFSIAQNLAPWFAIWSQTSFFGTAQSSDGLLTVRVINNLEGVRWQTKQYGPLRLYVKGGMGFSNFRMGDIGSDTKLSLGYGAGAQLWAKWLGLTFDASHIVMGLPNLTGANGRDKWDSGLTITTGLAIRF